MLALLLMTGMLQAAPPVHPLSLDFRTEKAETALTTETLWEIDPLEPNPHRARWALSRETRVEGFSAQARKNGFGLSSATIVGRVKVYERAEGPWFSAMARFSCEPQPDSWFATREGNAVAAQKAAQEWESLVGRKRGALAAQWARIRASSPDLAVAQGFQAFRSWLAELEAEWRSRGPKEARVAEWRYYLSEARETERCKARKRGKVASVVRPKWEDLMQPPVLPPADPDYRAPLLARAPARRWNGLFSVRVSIDAGSKPITGQFLVDSGATQSVMSPAWLERQGVPPELIAIPGARPRKVSWAGGQAYARVAQVSEARLAGLKLPLKEFLLLDTELFMPPESLSECCDGILGVDFFRAFAVEFVTDPPFALRIWPRESFHWGADQAWIEISSTPSGEIVSEDCVLEGANRSRLVGARWDTGSNAAIELHTPYAALAGAAKNRWTMNCQPGEEFRLARDIEVRRPLRGERAVGGPFQARFPAYNVGMELLGRGRFVVDLPNGRLWLDPKGIEKPVASNQTGLKLGFRYNRSGERELYVVAVRPNSAASALAREGLRAGLVISEVDSVAAGDLDLWMVERKLAGVDASQVVFQWESDRGRKLLPIRVK